MAERTDYGYAASNVVATIGKINGSSAIDISESPVGEILGKIHDLCCLKSVY